MRAAAATLAVVLAAIALPAARAQSYPFAVAAADSAAAAANVHGAYLGCFSTSLLPHLSQRAGGRLSPQTLDRCTPLCRTSNFTFSAIEGATYSCRCGASVPPDEARLPESSCASRQQGASALFYHHAQQAAGGRGCRLANLPFRPENFNIHYGAHNVFMDTANNQMTIRMEGTNGARVAVADGKKMYGVSQVEAIVSGASGAVSAFYTRSSDDYNLANTGDFCEIDWEWLNGHPGSPNSLWQNSYARGISGGERSVPVSEYAKLLGLPPGKTAGNTFIIYTFSWQPDNVIWSANGVPIERKDWGKRGARDALAPPRSYITPANPPRNTTKQPKPKTGQLIKWRDMKGVEFTRSYRPPAQPSHVTFSMWADGDQKRAFGGRLDWSRSPFFTSFRELRRVLCDVEPSSAPGGALPRGPQWLYSGLQADGGRLPWTIAAGAMAPPPEEGPTTGGADGSANKAGAPPPPDAASSAMASGAAKAELKQQQAVDAQTAAVAASSAVAEKRAEDADAADKQRAVTETAAAGAAAAKVKADANAAAAALAAAAAKLKADADAAAAAAKQKAAADAATAATATAAAKPKANAATAAAPPAAAKPKEAPAAPAAATTPASPAPAAGAAKAAAQKPAAAAAAAAPAAPSAPAPSPAPASKPAAPSSAAQNKSAPATPLVPVVSANKAAAAAAAKTPAAPATLPAAPSAAPAAAKPKP
jgi:hypothetical protein